MADKFAPRMAAQDRNTTPGETAMNHHRFAAALTLASALALTPIAGPALAAAPPAAQTVQIPTPPAGEAQKAEAALRKTIAAFVASKPNLEDMDAPLAEAVKQQSATLSTMLAGWGALKAIDYTGWNAQSDVWAFRASFAGGQAQCLIGFDKAGKIQTLWFKPA